MHVSVCEIVSPKQSVDQIKVVGEVTPSPLPPYLYFVDEVVRFYMCSPETIVLFICLSSFGTDLTRRRLRRRLCPNHKWTLPDGLTRISVFPVFRFYHHYYNSLFSYYLEDDWYLLLLSKKLPYDHWFDSQVLTGPLLTRYHTPDYGRVHFY